jgi:hypothetical protein
MDGKHTSMWGVWIILSVAVLVSLGVGLYFIIKHFTKCKPNCSGNKCNDGCGKACPCAHGCDTNSGKCKASLTTTVNSTWNSTTKSTGKNLLKRLLQNSNDQVLNNQLQKVNNQIPESVIECALKKIIDIYKNPQDFIKALTNPNMLQSLITIVNDCMKIPVDPPDPSTVCNPVCNIGEICIQNGCVPTTWTRSFYNKFRDGMIADVEKTIPINKNIASCITDGFKSKYPNPQKMMNENPDTIQSLFGDLYTKCSKTPQPPQPNPCNITISDTCISKGQDARNRSLDCGDTINSCMISGGANITDDCLHELERISGETCEHMKRYKPRRKSTPLPSDAVSYCVTQQNGECVCKNDIRANVRDGVLWSAGHGCEEQGGCYEDEGNKGLYCNGGITQLSSGIY